MGSPWNERRLNARDKAARGLYKNKFPISGRGAARSALLLREVID